MALVKLRERSKYAGRINILIDANCRLKTADFLPHRKN
jgi:hypothetical protein